MAKIIEKDLKMIRQPEPEYGTIDLSNLSTLQLPSNLSSINLSSAIWILAPLALFLKPMRNAVVTVASVLILYDYFKQKEELKTT